MIICQIQFIIGFLVILNPINCKKKFLKRLLLVLQIVFLEYKSKKKFMIGFLSVLYIYFTNKKKFGIDFWRFHNIFLSFLRYIFKSKIRILATKTSKKHNLQKWTVVSSRSPISKVMSIRQFST